MDTATRKLLTSGQEAALRSFEDEHDQHGGYSTTQVGATCWGRSEPGIHSSTQGPPRHPPIALVLSCHGRPDEVIGDGTLRTAEEVLDTTLAEISIGKLTTVAEIRAAIEAQGYTLALAGAEPTGELEAPYFDVLFDGPPAPESGRFIEVEDPQGRSINIGAWLEDDLHPGWWRLRIPTTAALEQLATGELDPASFTTPIQEVNAEADRADFDDRLELLKVAAGTGTAGDGLVELAGRLEQYCLTGTGLGRPLATTSAREVLAQALDATGGAAAGSLQRAATELVEWLGHQGYRIARAPETSF